MARQEDDKLYIKKNEVQKYCEKYGVLTQKELDDELWYSYGVILIVEKEQKMTIIDLHTNKIK